MADSFGGGSRLRPLRSGGIVSLVLWLGGCGTPGAPQPPTLNLPQPVNDLEAERTGDTVALTWTMPDETTDKLPVKGRLEVRICRQLDASACTPAGTATAAPDAAASFTDKLPPALASGAPHLLTYKVETDNHAGRSAGLSEPAYAASGVSPAALAGFHVQVRPRGVLLLWSPVPEGADSAPDTVRIERTILETPGKVHPAARHRDGVPPEQMLEVKLSGGSAGSVGAGPDRALDTQASFGQSYRYRAQGEVTRSVNGQPLTVYGPWSDPVTVDVRDVFPPAVPVGLISAPDTGAGAIDLSWTPNADADLAGYVVYRRDLGASGPPVRISDPKALLPTPSYRDTTPQPGKRYAYSVTAVDRAGNESRPSAEVEDGLPLPPSK